MSILDKDSMTEDHWGHLTEDILYDRMKASLDRFNAAHLKKENTMNTTEVLKLVLEALTALLDEWTPARQAQLKGMEAVTTIKQALAAPTVQEPWGYGRMSWGEKIFLPTLPSVRDGGWMTLYTTPPAAQPAPTVQEPVLKPLSKKWKWVLHESFADVAGFDEEGFPLFYWKESVTKFKSGELSVPCKGKNCGSLNGWLHSVECRAEHEAQYTTPPAARRQWVGLTDSEKADLWKRDTAIPFSYADAIEAKLKEKNT
jgi:hypothetical protein